jgi:hypothetical protein
MRTWLFNPFKYIAGTKALLIGLTAMLATAVIAFFSHTHFDGAIDAHYGPIAPFHWFLIDQILAWLPAVIVLYLAGLLFSRSAVRFIDISGTLALARWPYIFLALVNWALPPAFPKDIHHPDSSLILNALVTLLVMIWLITLFYNAFSTSTNLKNSRGTIVFILALLVAEALSKFAFYQFYHHLH